MAKRPSPWVSRNRRTARSIARSIATISPLPLPPRAASQAAKHIRAASSLSPIRQPLRPAAVASSPAAPTNAKRAPTRSTCPKSSGCLWQTRRDKGFHGACLPAQLQRPCLAPLQRVAAPITGLAARRVAQTLQVRPPGTRWQNRGLASATPPRPHHAGGCWVIHCIHGAFFRWHFTYMQKVFALPT